MVYAVIVLNRTCVNDHRNLGSGNMLAAALSTAVNRHQLNKRAETNFESIVRTAPRLANYNLNIEYYENTEPENGRCETAIAQTLFHLWFTASNVTKSNDG